MKAKNRGKKGSCLGLWDGNFQRRAKNGHWKCLETAHLRGENREDVGGSVVVEMRSIYRAFCAFEVLLGMTCERLLEGRKRPQNMIILGSEKI